MLPRGQRSCDTAGLDLDADAYRLLFDANPLQMFVADRESLQILLVNRAACELYGWSRRSCPR